MEKKANLRVIAFILAAFMIVSEVICLPSNVMAKGKNADAEAEEGLYEYAVEGVGTYYYSLDSNNKATIEKFVISDSITGKINYTVPTEMKATVDEQEVKYAVKSVGVGAYCDCKQLKSVTIPSKIGSLKQGAFYNCNNLKSVIFKSKSTTIGKYAIGYIAASSADKVNVGSTDQVMKSDPKRIDNIIITGTSKKSKASKYCGNNGFTFKYKSGKSTKYIYGYPTISVSNTAKGIKISWAKIGGIKNYYVYKTTNGVRWKKVKTTKGGSYVDKKVKNGKKAYYIVYANKGKVQTVSERLLGCRVTKTSLKSVSSSENTMTVSIKKNAAASKYQIQYSMSEKFDDAVIVTVNKSKKTTITKKIGELMSGTYYVRVRAYKTAEKKKFYGAWSLVKSVEVADPMPQPVETGTAK